MVVTTIVFPFNDSTLLISISQKIRSEDDPIQGNKENFVRDIAVIPFDK